MNFEFPRVLFSYSLAATNSVVNAPNEVPIKVLFFISQLYFSSSLDKILEVLKEYDLDLTVRAENLTIEQFIEISNKLNEE